MNKTNINRMFLMIILLHICLVILMVFGLIPEDVQRNMLMNILMSECVLIGPAFLFVRYMKKEENAKASMTRGLGFAKIRISSIFLVILTTVLLDPFVIMLNALTMLVADNAVAVMSESILELPALLGILLIGVLAPMCEEIVFRGIIYRGYRREKGMIPAVILSAFLFGLMHMNFNQAVYAFALGIAMALLVEATGSLWGSVICHVFFNTSEMVLMYLANYMTPGIYATSEAMPGPQDMYLIISVYAVFAALTLPCAIGLLCLLAKREGNGATMRRELYLHIKDLKDLITWPLVIAIVLSIGYIAVTF